MEWLKTQWDDIKGNAKWTLLAAFPTVGAIFRSWFFEQPSAVRVWATVAFAEGIALAVVTLLWLTARTRPAVSIKINDQKATPAFLFPRETKPIAVPAFESNALREFLKLTFKDNKPKGMVAYLRNDGIKPLSGCYIMLMHIGKWHAGRSAFREPEFSPVRLTPPTTLQPDQTSEGAWIVQSTTFSKISIPTGLKGEFETVTEGGVWLFQFEIHDSVTSYKRAIQLSWSPGTPPFLKTA